MIPQRAQTAMLVALSAIAAVAIVVLIGRPDPHPPQSKSTSQSELDSASQEPAGMLVYQAAPGDLILRLRTGSCHAGGSPTIELSDDDGWSFRVIRTPQIDDGTGIDAVSRTISVIVAFEVEARRHFTLWGADEKCRVRSYETTDAGRNWKQGNLPMTAWHIDPKTGIVFSPRGAASVDCDGIATLNAFGQEQAVATCVDHTVHITDDRGKTWKPAPNLDDSVTAVFFGSTKRGFALLDEANCRSRLYSSDDGGESWTKGGCVLESNAMPALGGTSKRLVAGGSSVVWTSVDGGDTWKRPTEPKSDAETPGQQPTPSASTAEKPVENPEEPSDAETSEAAKN